jgi:uncharacterized protein (TIGR02270 family)
MLFHRHNISKRIEIIGKNARYFSEDIYMEHLEEVSFLYESRLYLLNDYGGPWPDMATIETRIEAHIDALVMGEGLALDLCRQQIDEGNQGVLYAVVRVFCRHKKDDWFKEVQDGLDPGNTNRVNAVTDALNHDLPEAWHPMVEQMLLSSDPWVIRMALTVIGYRRLPMDEPLLNMLNRPHDEIFGLVIRTLGRLRVVQARDVLFHLFHNDHEEDVIKQDLCMALLRLQVTGLVPVPMDKSDCKPWVYMAMGLCGGVAHVSYLNDISLSEGVCHESLLALGFLGGVSSVDILMSHLHNEVYSKTASLALHLITGAALYEDVFIPDPIDEDTLFEEEREKLRRGEPVYPPGKEPGVTIHRVSQNPISWKTWWLAHAFGFDHKTSYRFGKPHSPAGILHTLESEKSPTRLRQLAYEEFAIRYDKDVYFDTTFPVSEQRRALNSYRQWVETEHRTT